MKRQKKISIWLKRLIFALLVGALFTPMAEEYFDYYEEEELNGYYLETEEPKLQFKNWLDGSFQKQAATYRQEQMGFRQRIIRFYNQWHYDLYNQARANNVIIGKEEYLFGKEYIKAYQGLDFLGVEEIKKRMFKLEKIRDTLATKNIDLIVLLAPGKASFFSEYIPPQYIKKPQAQTNYAEIRNQLYSNNIHCLDFYAWFNQMKKTTPYPLFPKTGIHWSKYAEVLVADSILNHLAELQNRPMPQLERTGFESTRIVRDTDDDIEKGMNIFYEIPDLEMGYFSTRIKRDSTLNYPKISLIGDSYCWGLVGLGLVEEGFKQGDFWYYFNELHRKDKPMVLRNDIDNVLQRLEDNDALVLLSTDANLKTFFHGFVSEVYDLYYPRANRK